MKYLIITRNIVAAILLLPLLAYASLFALPIAIGVLIYKSSKEKGKKNAGY